MKSLKFLFLAALGVIAITFTAIAGDSQIKGGFQQNRAEMRKMVDSKVESFASAVNLTAAQQQQLIPLIDQQTALRKEGKGMMREGMKTRREVRREWRNLSDEQKAQVAEAGKDARASFQAHGEKRRELVRQAEAILTPEQRAAAEQFGTATLTEMRAKIEARRNQPALDDGMAPPEGGPEFGGHGHGGRGGMGMMGPAGKALDLARRAPDDRYLKAREKAFERFSENNDLDDATAETVKTRFYAILDQARALSVSDFGLHEEEFKTSLRDLWFENVSPLRVSVGMFMLNPHMGELIIGTTDSPLTTGK